MWVLVCSTSVWMNMYFIYRMMINANEAIEPLEWLPVLHHTHPTIWINV